MKKPQLTTTLSGVLIGMGTLTVELVILGSSELLRALGAVVAADNWAACETQARCRAKERTGSEHLS